MNLSAKNSIYPYMLAMTFTAMCSPSAWAGAKEYQQLKGDALTAAFMETTVFSEYQRAGGGIKNEQFTETHHANGETDYQELGTPKIKGEWQIVGDDKICYRYPGNEVFTKTYCFFVYKSGTCYYNYGPGQMTLKGPYNWDLWTSRFVRKGDGGSCAKPVS